MTWYERLKAAVEGESHRVFKEFVTEVRAIEGAGQQYTFTISTESTDRDRDQLAAAGWDLKNYLKNPVVLWAHDYHTPPVAVARSITTTASGLTSVADFSETSKIHQLAATVDALIRIGALRATSVGFAPKKWNYNEERRGVDFTEQELLEYSIVPVPANAECLIEARGAGIDVEPMREWASKTLERLSAPIVPKDVADAIALIERAVPDIKRFYSFSAETKKVPSDVSDAKAPKDEAWSAPSLKDFTDKSWSDLSDAEKRRIAGHFAWSAAMPPKSYGDLKLPHHRASDGAVVFRGVVAAAGRLNQTEGVDEAAVKRHLARHYHQFDEKAPWENDGRAADIDVKNALGGDDEPIPDMPDMPEHMRESGQHFSRAQSHMGHAMAALSRATHAAHSAGEHDHADAIHDVHNKMAKVARAAGDCMRAMTGVQDDDNDAGTEPDGDADDDKKAAAPSAPTTHGEAKADAQVPETGIVDASAEVEIDIEKIDDFVLEDVKSTDVDVTKEDIVAALREFVAGAASEAVERALARARGRVD